MLLQSTKQINGTSSHSACDEGRYSDKKSILQGIPIICEEYGLVGKIDVFDSGHGILTERKKKINQIYDGYVFQLYAQYFALSEMGYTVKSIRLYSIDDNKVYDIPLPENDEVMLGKFKKLIWDIQNFRFYGFHQTNILKCKNCIYEPICSYSCEENAE